MVGRHEQQINHNAVIVDLDGTLICGNTLRMYMKYCIISYMHSFRIGRLLRMVVAIILRGCRISTHIQMKRNIMTLTTDLNDDKHINEFVDKVFVNINTAVESDLKSLQSTGHPVYLATAAPEIYSTVIASRINAAGVVATPFPSKKFEWQETRGDEKLSKVKKLLDINEHKIWRVYTDHHDDLPIVTNAIETILVNPSKKSVEKVVKSGAKFGIMGRIH